MFKKILGATGAAIALSLTLGAPAAQADDCAFKLGELQRNLAKAPGSPNDIYNLFGFKNGGDLRNEICK